MTLACLGCLVYCIFHMILGKGREIIESRDKLAFYLMK